MSAIPVKIICACGQKYSFDVHPVNGRMPAPIFCPVCGRDGTYDANRIIERDLNKPPVPVKIICACGQKYSFDAQLVGGRMAAPVFCPACGKDGTLEAEQVISRILNGKTQPVAPPTVNSLLSSLQTTLAPHLTQALKDAVVHELAAQRRALLAAQQEAAAELTALARRLEAVQTPLLERLRAYEQRLEELQKELAQQTKENRELLKLKIEMTRAQLETERSRVRFN